MKYKMRAIKTRNIQSRLFSTYSIIIISTLLITTTFFYVWMSNVLKSRAFDDIQKTSISMSQKLNDEIRNMDTVSINVCYSNLVKSRFENYMKYSASNEKTVDSINNSKELTDMLTAIIGPNRQVQQIFLYDFYGQVFGTGFDNRQMAVDIQQKSVYKYILKNNGNKFIANPEKNASLSSIISTNNADIYFISLYRMYYDQFNVQQGVVEVLQYCSNVFSDLSTFENNDSLQESLYVFNSNGQQIYPYSGVRKDSGNYYYQRCKTEKNTNFTITNPSTHKKDLVAYTASDYTGFTTVVVSDQNTILSSFGTFTLFTILVMILVMFTALLFSFYAAKAFTKPIKTLRQNMRTIASHDQLTDVPDLNSNLTELEELNQSFRHMNQKIKISLDELLLSQKNEMDSKMLALQSQMNPHFLYNSLATISIMAEENLDDEIVKMCENMCDILRYISSDVSKSVPLITETSNTLKYIECIKLRFGDRINYSIDIDDNMKNLKIPKLVIQPLVENAIKYASLASKFINISVKGKMSDGCWTVSVEDNGIGFSKQALDKINSKISEIENGGLLPSLEIEGMGLINIYIRLKLMYKDKTCFNIKRQENTQDHMAHTIVEIGGSAQIIQNENDEPFPQ